MPHSTISDASPRRTLRSVIRAVAALAIGGLVAAGMALPAAAAAGTTGSAAGSAASASHSASASVAAAAAKKSKTGSLTIKVTAGGAVVPGATVELYEVYGGGEYTYRVSTRVANSKGAVKFSRVSTRYSFAVKVLAPDVNPAFDAYATGWYGKSLKKSGVAVPSVDSTTAGAFKVKAGATTKTVGLATGGVLDGVLYGADGAPFTSGFSVVAYRQLPSPSDEENEDSGYPAQLENESTVYVEPSATGAYAIPGLRAGTYIVEFDQSADPASSSRIYNAGATNLVDAEMISPFGFDGKTASVDGHLVAAGSISGTVSFAPAVTGTDDLGTVEAYTPRPDSDWGDTYEGDLFASAPISSDGSYELTGLNPNDYAIKFVPAKLDELYFGEWYDDAATRGAAELVDVEAGADVTADATLAQGYSLSGVVTDHAGKPLKGIDVDLESTDYLGNGESFSGTTNSKGKYSFTDVSPSSYVLSFRDPKNVYPDRFYAAGHAGGVRDYSAAGELTYTEGAHTANLVYDELSALKIKLATRTGVPVKRAYVRATPVVDGHEDSTADYQFGDSVKGKPGVYSFPDLEIGHDYAFSFSFYSAKPKGAYDQYLGGATELVDADLVTARAGSHTLDATLAVGGIFSGTLKTSAGTASKGSYAVLYRFSGSTWDEWDYTVVSSKGAYSFGALDTGSYTVGFSAADEYYGQGPATFAGGAVSPETARAFRVTPGKHVVYSMKLPALGKLGGKVVDTAGTGIKKIRVVALRLIGEPGAWTDYAYAGSAVSISTGAYSLKLPAGSYALAYVDDANKERFATAFRNPVTDPDAPVFVVAAGTTVAAGRQELLPASDGSDATGLISGSLDAEIPEAAGSLYLFSDTGGYVLNIETDGTFSGTVPPGDYSYEAEFYSQTSDVEYAPSFGTINVVEGQNTLVLPVSPLVAPQFGDQPTLNTDATAVGTVYSVAATWNNPSASFVEYQWLRDGKPIKWATKASYTSVGADLGATLSVRVTIGIWWNESVSATATLAGAVTESTRLANTTAPSITTSGPAVAGTTLRASAGEWSVPGATFTYEWFRNDTVSVGTGSTYTLGADDANQAISVVVHASKVGYADAEATSRTIVVAPTASLVVVTQPTIVGTSKSSAAAPVNSILRASPGEWSVPAKYSYTWLRDGKLIPGATSSSYKTVDRDYGYEISAQVTASASGFTTATVETNGFIVSLGDALTYKTRASLTGKSVVGGTLKSRHGTWKLSNLTFGYVWLSNGVVIDGATDSSLVLTQAQKGTKITVQVTAKRHGYQDGISTSKATTTVK